MCASVALALRPLIKNVVGFQGAEQTAHPGTFSSEILYPTQTINSDIRQLVWLVGWLEVEVI